MNEKEYKALLKVAIAANTYYEISRYWADLDPQIKAIHESIEKLPDYILEEIKSRVRFPWKKHKFNEEIEPLMKVAICAHKIRPEYPTEDIDVEEKRLKNALNSLPEDILSKINWDK